MIKTFEEKPYVSVMSRIGIRKFIFVMTSSLLPFDSSVFSLCGLSLVKNYLYSLTGPLTLLFGVIMFNKGILKVSYRINRNLLSRGITN